jgi:hypothetical protein
MTAAAAITRAPGETTLELYRDDGALARALGAALGPAVRLDPVLSADAAAGSVRREFL